MNLIVHGSTKVGYVLPVDEAMKMSGIAAGICYMPDNFDSLLAEPESKTINRANGAIASVHHSVFGHATYNLVLEGMPKIIAMLLNNEKDYTTSEKSARYTTMSVIFDEEREIYEKWIDLFSKKISSTYPTLSEKVVSKLARENARYFISVFTPATAMEYTVSFQQANYIIGWCDKLAAEDSPNPFIWRLRPCLNELSDLLRNALGVDGLTDHKGRSFSLFSDKYRMESFGDTYCTNYEGSFAMLAQVQRHRTLSYEMRLPDLSNCSFYVPHIIRGDSELRSEYLSDMDSLKDRYPQGMKVKINERGTAEMFMLKCMERLCGAVQLETCEQTKATLDLFIKRTGEPSKWMFDSIHQELKAFEGRSKCQLGYYECNRPCPLGPNSAFNRLV